MIPEGLEFAGIGRRFAALYDASPLARRIDGAWAGLKYAFWLWLVIYLWNLSHPLVYGSIETSDQVFWLVYSMGGFLAYGSTLGYICRRWSIEAVR